MIYKKATIDDIDTNLVFPCYCCQNNKNGDLREASPTCWDKCEHDRGVEGKSNFRPFFTLEGGEWTEMENEPPLVIVRADLAPAREGVPVGWLPISSAPKDGTPILARADGYSMPFVAWWGNDAYERGDLQSGGVAHSFDRHWCVAGCEDGDGLLYEPTHWKKLTEEG